MTLKNTFLYGIITCISQFRHYRRFQNYANSKFRNDRQQKQFEFRILCNNADLTNQNLYCWSRDPDENYQKLFFNFFLIIFKIQNHPIPYFFYL